MGRVLCREHRKKATPTSSIQYRCYPPVSVVARRHGVEQPGVFALANRVFHESLLHPPDASRQAQRPEGFARVSLNEKPFLNRRIQVVAAAAGEGDPRPVPRLGVGRSADDARDAVHIGGLAFEARLPGRTAAQRT